MSRGREEQETLPTYVGRVSQKNNSTGNIDIGGGKAFCAGNFNLVKTDTEQQNKTEREHADKTQREPEKIFSRVITHSVCAKNFFT